MQTTTPPLSPWLPSLENLKKAFKFEVLHALDKIAGASRQNHNAAWGDRHAEFCRGRDERHAQSFRQCRCPRDRPAADVLQHLPPHAATWHTDRASGGRTAPLHQPLNADHHRLRGLSSLQPRVRIRCRRAEEQRHKKTRRTCFEDHRRRRPLPLLPRWGRKFF